MDKILIRGGWVIDGTGKDRYSADVLVENGVITKIGTIDSADNVKVLNADGMIVSPGFIDAHAHSDTCFLSDDSYAAKLYQGITTEISGQCGDSPFPCSADRISNDQENFSGESFSDFVRRFHESGYKMAVNQAMLIGHGALRACVMGYEDRKPTDDEQKNMEKLLRQSLLEGAWGMSLGLEYSPGFFAGGEELAHLASIVREFDGLVPCHMRNEGIYISDAIDELCEIGKRSSARVHISHLKLDNFRVHGQAEKVWKKIEEMKESGVQISADMYPFTASCTSLSIRCPKWSREGGNDALLKRLTGEAREKVIDGIREHYFSKERAKTCMINDDGGCWPEIVSKTLDVIAEEYLHTDDYAAAAAEILIRTKGRAGCIFFVMSEEDMMYFLRRNVGIGSDGWAYSGDEAKVKSKPHPRSYAAISRFFEIARETGMCTLEEAVYRVTKKCADMIGFTDRGVLGEGYKADICVFDENDIGASSTYLTPVALSKGVMHVLVNGKIALENGRQTEERAGEYLKKR
ncbi:MAG: D-aminoacylase [Clostridia bacterium]|nr:D-aminoacylase [Clostridia bacterium]